MSVFWWILIAYLIWATAGACRVISLLGHKNHKDTLLDKIFIPAVMPIAFIMGVITFISRSIRRD